MTCHVGRDTGADPNDWITSTINPPARSFTAKRGPLDFGEKRLGIWWHIELYAGAGANDFVCEPVVIPNDDQHFDDWEIWPAPFGPIGNAYPIAFSNADLPVDFFGHIPRWLSSFALKLTRTGAGSEELRIHAYLDDG